MRHIHTSIVSRHLATRGNNKILRTPPPHISSSEERLPCLTRRTLAQLRTNKSPFLESQAGTLDSPPLAMAWEWVDNNSKSWCTAADETVLVSLYLYMKFNLLINWITWDILKQQRFHQSVGNVPNRYNQ